jgi:hypothetical protein
MRAPRASHAEQQKAWESTVNPTASNSHVHWLSPLLLHKKLVRSLACYVTPEDACLTRGQFLRTVMSRIEDDLHYDQT